MQQLDVDDGTGGRRIDELAPSSFGTEPRPHPPRSSELALFSRERPLPLGSAGAAVPGPTSFRRRKVIDKHRHVAGRTTTTTTTRDPTDHEAGGARTTAAQLPSRSDVGFDLVSDVVAGSTRPFKDPLPGGTAPHHHRHHHQHNLRQQQNEIVSSPPPSSSSSARRNNNNKNDADNGQQHAKLTRAKSAYPAASANGSRHLKETDLRVFAGMGISSRSASSSGGGGELSSSNGKPVCRRFNSQPARMPKMPPFREVPPFSVQVLQRNTRPIPPPHAGRASSLSPRPTPRSATFRKYYLRGDFPLSIRHDARGNKLDWKVPLDEVDLAHFLPIFFEGLAEVEYPYEFIAKAGIADMVNKGGQKLLPILPYLVPPLRRALDTRHPRIMAATLKVIQQLATSCREMGQMLVPYYRHILPTLNIYITKNKNIYDSIDYGQYRGENLGDMIWETLETLEKTGGPLAFINIKYVIPIYESCLLF